jgi:3-methyladenine DNA glycosylase AlkD
MTLHEIRKVFRELADPEFAQHSQRFFKSGPGEYGEGDRFLGIRVPALRKQVKQHLDISLKDVIQLVKSPFHEERLFALLLLVAKFDRGSAEEQKTLYELYLNHTKYINNWDLVDSSASHIVGAYLEKKAKKPLFDLARSDSLWERRIAIIATLHLIRKREYAAALQISAMLKNDPEDLIQRAVGWMLREIGKRDLWVEQAFLKQHYTNMPRTLLRQAIERFPEPDRKRYLHATLD